MRPSLNGCVFRVSVTGAGVTRSGQSTRGRFPVRVTATGWSGWIWGSRARTRCGCSVTTAGRCTGGAVSRRWLTWPGWRRPQPSRCAAERPTARLQARHGSARPHPYGAAQPARSPACAPRCVVTASLGGDQPSRPVWPAQSLAAPSIERSSDIGGVLMGGCPSGNPAPGMIGAILSGWHARCRMAG